MKHIDPKMANRVWQRVQASLNQPTPAISQPLAPVPVITVPPEAWKNQDRDARPRRKTSCRPCSTCRQPQGIHPALLWLLLGGKLF